MANPLERRERSIHARYWPVGETRFIGKDQGVAVTRTERDYVYDLCDAYNQVRTRDDIEWFVAGGQLHLGVPLDASLRTSKQIESRKETERARWLRNHLNYGLKDEPNAHD